MEAPNKHSLLGPSRAHRYLHCAGSVAMEGDNRTTSTYAGEGVAAHALAAMALENKRPAAAYIGRILDHAHDHEVTHEMAEHVQTYMDKLEEYASYLDHCTPPTVAEIHVEILVDVSGYLGVPDQKGTADAVIYRPDIRQLQVHDLKYGMGVRVDAEENEQLMLYAGGAYDYMSLFCPIDSILLVIHQPRLYHLSEWEIKPERLEEFREFAMPRAQKAFELYSTGIGNMTAVQNLNPGESQCRFCSARPHCPALIKVVDDMVTEHFTDLDAPGTVNLPDNNEKLGRLGKLVPLARILCNAVDAKIYTELMSGREVPDFKMIRGKAGNRFWNSKDAVEEYLKLNDPDELTNLYTAPELLSPAKAEKIIGAKTPLWKRLLEYVSQAEGSLKAVPADHKSPAVSVVPTESYFGNLENEDGE